VGDSSSIDCATLSVVKFSGKCGASVTVPSCVVAADASSPSISAVWVFACSLMAVTSASSGTTH